MSNKGIRDLKRKKRKQAQRRRKIRLIKVATCSFILVGAFKLGFSDKNDDFVIKRPIENRTASAINIEDEDFSDEPSEELVQIATSRGFEDLKINDKLKIVDDGYSDELKAYVTNLKNQSCYQFPNDYSKVEECLKKGGYVEYYGSENSFSKIKLNDKFYYVNSHGLSKLANGKKIKVEKSIVLVDEDNPLPEDFNPGVSSIAKKSLDTMTQDMARHGLKIKVASDFRSFNTEEKLSNGGNPDADLPGLSDHQTGTAFDFYTQGDKYQKDFEKTEEYQWLAENSYKYGFLGGENLSKKEKDRPRHFRFVGVEASKNIYNNNLSLEDYIGSEN